MATSQTPIRLDPGGAIPIRVVGIDRAILAVRSSSHLVIDARPELFWEIGHIPSSINLPMKEFEEYYPKAEPILGEAVAAGRTLLIYCADLHCPDAGRLAKKLKERGFQAIEVFEEGWAAWEEARQPVEIKQ